MAFKIGFTAESFENKAHETKHKLWRAQSIPRKSMVHVYFQAKNTTLAYYNDQLNLHCGDMVYVEGKLEGLRDLVTDVNYK